MVAVSSRLIRSSGTFAVILGLLWGSQGAASAIVGDVWEAVPMPTGQIAGAAIAYGDGQFVAVDYLGTEQPNSVMTSPDGVTWTVRSAPQRRWTDVAYANGLFVAVAARWNGTLPGIFTSSDGGRTWTEQGLNLDDSTVDYGAVTFGHGKFIAAGTKWNFLSPTGFAATSPDGVTWTTVTTRQEFGASDITATDQGFVAVSGNLIFVSAAEPLNWVTFPPSSSSPQYVSVTSGQGPAASTVVALDSRGGITTSTDGGWTWTQAMTQKPPGMTDQRQWSAVTYGAGAFVAVQQGTVNSESPTYLAATSADGLTWVPKQTLPDARPWYSLAYGNCAFVALQGPVGASPGMISRVGGTVTFVPNGGTGSMTPQHACQLTPLVGNAFTRPGHTFAGWSTTALGAATITDRQNYAFTSDTTLYAQWTPNPAAPATASPTTTTATTPSAVPTPTVAPTPIAAPPAVTIPSVGSARVIFRQVMGARGSQWQPVVRVGKPGAYRYVKPKTAPRIPTSALVTVVSSGDPARRPSLNIPAATRQAKVLAAQAQAQVHSTVLKGSLWRGPARIIVNW